MKYFKKKNGQVFSKKNDVRQSKIDEYLERGCVPCDKDGKPLKAKKKPVLKKKKWKQTIFCVIVVTISGNSYGPKMIKYVAQNADHLNFAS